MKKFLFLSLFSSTLIFSQLQDSIVDKKTQEYKVFDNITLIYSKPRISNIYSEIPKNFVGVAKNVVDKETYLYSLAALGATAALIPVDPILIRTSRKFGENIGFSENHTYHHLGPLQIIPGDAGSFFYFMGNGTTFLLIGAGLATYGLIKNDYRAQSTSMQLVQGVLLAGLFSQPLKRITGRESPFETMA
ncbi:hypothetical protein [Kaistella sp.]|uniref:hypothetical protein n=1 Tax=Kaistella sp. TaxID=2782235 RepID=UPI003C5FAED4